MYTLVVSRDYSVRQREGERIMKLWELIIVCFGIVAVVGALACGAGYLLIKFALPAIMAVIHAV